MSNNNQEKRKEIYIKRNREIIVKIKRSKDNKEKQIEVFEKQLRETHIKIRD